MSALRQIERINLAGGPARVAGPFDPSAVGLALPEGSIYHRNQPGAGELWLKFGGADTEWSQITPNNGFDDLFEDANGTPMKPRWTNYQEANCVVTQQDGRYRALIDDNDTNQNGWFQGNQGRADWQLISFPFEVIAFNVGAGLPGDSQTAPVPGVDVAASPYCQCSLMVHVETQATRSYQMITAGHRGSSTYAIISTSANVGSSGTNDLGDDSAPLGRADLRVVGDDVANTLEFFYRLPGDAIWIPHSLPVAQTPTFGENVYVGLASGTFLTASLPFVGTCDGIVRIA